MKIVLISVVRDFAMYEKCIAANPHLAEVERVTFDNRERNEPIPVLYNRFLDGYDYSEPAWFVFCHEDFQVLEPPAPHLEAADAGSLWGPVGARTTWCWGVNPRLTICGEVQESDKAGEGVRMLGRGNPTGAAPDTLDCMCIAVHSSLVRSHRLRFDPRFVFDLYAEDFCVAAGRLGIVSRILLLGCRHWSRGESGARYHEAERAFAAKWPDVCVTGTSSEVLGGGAGAVRRMLVGLKSAKRRFVASESLTGMSWALVGKFAVKAVQFGFGVVLARLLCPADFGLAGMVAIFMSLGDVLMDGGLVAALIRKKDRTEDDYATVFWSKLAASLAICAVLFVCAPAVAAFYALPELRDVMRVVIMGLPVAACSSVLVTRLQVNMRFRDFAAVSLLSVLLSGAVGIFLAWRGLGVWAVVGQGLAWHVCTLLILAAANRWLPRGRFSFALLREFFDFGWKHLARGVLDAVYGNAYAVVIGKAFGAGDLGLFSRADYYTAEIGTTVGGAVKDVNYPLLSGIQDDDAGLRRSYRRLQLLVASVMIPAMALFAVFAEPLIRLVIGEHWVPCVPYLRVLAVGAAFSPLVTLTTTLMYVKGRSDIALRLELVEKPVAFGLLIAATPFGILAICVAKSFSTLAIFLVNSYAVQREVCHAP